MNAPLAKLSRIPADVAAVADYERLARERLSEEAWAYIAGGAADEWTLRENGEAFRRLTLRTRVLRDLSGGNTDCELFGTAHRFPIVLAPVAFQKLAHPEGEIETVLGASAAQACMVVSTQASVSLEEIARQSSSPLWFQLYFQPDREVVHELVRRAESAGYRALVVTVDAPVSAMRNREQRAGFSMPPGVEAVNLKGLPAAAMPARTDAQPLLLGGPLLADVPTWKDIEWLRSITSLPLLIKGIMTPDDALLVLAAGADAVIVSNHGGRILDGQPATISVLPEIVAATEDRIPVLLDGGIRRGSDIFKAIALGARAVLIGRPFIFGLAAAGAVGVSHVIRILRAEFEATMALTGCENLRAIDRSRVRGPIAGF